MALSAGWPTRRTSAPGHVSPVTARIVHGWLVSAGTTITRMLHTIHMEILDAEGRGEDLAPAHYSTGRLTRGQSALINTWRARLLLDRPLPGRDRVSEAARLLGMDNRPPASCSDIIAAAVAELLRQPPDGLDLARYAHAGWQTQRAAGRGNGDDDKAPLYPPARRGWQPCRPPRGMAGFGPGRRPGAGSPGGPRPAATAMMTRRRCTRRC